MTLPALMRYGVKSHRRFPDIISGYRINGKFSVVVPLGVDVTNLVTNPSLETNTTGYTAHGSATIARTTAFQRRGAYSLAVTPTAAQYDGAFFGTVPTVGGTTYTFTCDFKGIGGQAYRIYVASTVGNAVSPYYSFKAKGRWERVSVTYTESTAPGVATNRRLYITKDASTSTGIFYIDGLQFTATAFPLTYFDGSNKGFLPNRTDFYWSGTPDGSTSTMTAQTRAGGKLIPLTSFGFTLLAILGLGMTPIQNVALPLAARGGESFQTTVEQGRVFDLVGALTAPDLGSLQRRRSDLINVLKPDNVPFDQPLFLQYVPTDDCGNEIGDTVMIPCSYAGGLEGKTDNHYQERLNLRFQVYLPFVGKEDGWNGATLGYQQSIANANEGVTRSTAGLWSSLGSGFNGAVRAIAVDTANNRVYFGGTFTTANGVTVNRICYWNGTTFVSMDNGVNGGVRAITVAANGDVWVAGTFTTVGSGAAAAKGLARWNFATSTWSPVNVSTATFTGVYSLVIDYAGTLYIGGAFTDWNGNVNSDNTAKFDGSTWSSLGTGMNFEVDGIAAAPDGKIYMTGQFTTGNGVTLNFVGYWNGTTFVSMGGGMTGGGNFGDGLAVAPDGSVYVVGRITIIGGVTVSNIAKWNGTGWIALGSGLTGGAQEVVVVYVLKSGVVIAGGNFTAAGGLAINDQVAQWNGAAWSPVDVNLPGTPVVYAVGELNYALYLGFDTTGTAVAPVVTTITNTGVVKAYPRVILTGPGTVQELYNYTTGRVIYFNLTLLGGEIATLDLSDPLNIQFYSNFRSNLLSTILPGSTLDWFLLPGANNVSLFIAGSVNVNTAAVLSWQNTYHSLDGAVGVPAVK